MTAAAFSSAIGTAGSWIVSIALLLFTLPRLARKLEFSCVALVKLIGQKGEDAIWPLWSSLIYDLLLAA